MLETVLSKPERVPLGSFLGIIDAIVLTDCMDVLIQSTELEPGIARTTGLKENVFMVIVCTLARIPLMIVRARHI